MMLPTVKLAARESAKIPLKNLGPLFKRVEPALSSMASCAKVMWVYPPDKAFFLSSDSLSYYLLISMADV